MNMFHKLFFRMYLINVILIRPFSTENGMVASSHDHWLVGRTNSVHYKLHCFNILSHHSKIRIRNSSFNEWVVYKIYFNPVCNIPNNYKLHDSEHLNFFRKALSLQSICLHTERLSFLNKRWTKKTRKSVQFVITFVLWFSHQKRYPSRTWWSGMKPNIAYGWADCFIGTLNQRFIARIHAHKINHGILCDFCSLFH